LHQKTSTVPREPFRERTREFAPSPFGSCFHLCQEPIVQQMLDDQHCVQRHVLGHGSGISKVDFLAKKLKQRRHHVSLGQLLTWMFGFEPCCNPMERMRLADGDCSHPFSEVMLVEERGQELLPNRFEPLRAAPPQPAPLLSPFEVGGEVESTEQLLDPIGNDLVLHCDCHCFEEPSGGVSNLLLSFGGVPTCLPPLNKHPHHLRQATFAGQQPCPRFRCSCLLLCLDCRLLIFCKRHLHSPLPSTGGWNGRSHLLLPLCRYRSIARPTEGGARLLLLGSGSINRSSNRWLCAIGSFVGKGWVHCGGGTPPTISTSTTTTTTTGRL
jgi:hypothetical protein